MTEDINATDAARRLADEEGVDLAEVSGSGSGGQITKPDVEAAMSTATSAEDASSAAEVYEDPLIYVNFNPDHPDLGVGTSALHLAGRMFYPGENDTRNVMRESEWENYRGLGKGPESSHAYLRKGGAVNA